MMNYGKQKQHHPQKAQEQIEHLVTSGLDQEVGHHHAGKNQGKEDGSIELSIHPVDVDQSGTESNPYQQKDHAQDCQTHGIGTLMIHLSRHIKASGFLL